MKKWNLLVLIVFLCSCSQTDEQDLSQLEWILGQWKSQSGEEVIIEHWQKVNDTLFNGETWFIDSGDTVATELLKIIARSDNIFYVAEPSGQQNTEFKLTQLKNNEVLFENPEHDFPQKIFYKKTSSDSLYAKIEGVIDGRQQSMDFNWTLLEE